MPPKCMLDKIIDECERWGVVVAIESNDWEGEVLDYLKEYRDYREKVEHLHDACEHCLYYCHIDPCCPFAKLGREEERE